MPTQQGFRASSNSADVKRWLGRIGLLLGGLLVALLLAEVGLRLRSAEGPESLLVNGPNYYDQSIFQSDPELVHVLAPDSRGVFRSPEFSAVVEVNSEGLRGPSSDGRRLVVGDSFTLGVQVAHEDTFAGRLGLLNAGTDSYGTLQEVLLAERIVARREIDAILLVAFTGNDLFENEGFPPPRITNPPERYIPAWERTLSRHSFLFFHVLAVQGRRRMKNPRVQGRYRQELATFTERGRLPGLEKTAEALERLEALCHERDCAVAIAPPAFVVHTKRAEATFQAFGVEGSPDLDRPARAIAERVPTSIPMLDLTPALRAAANEPLYFTYDGHWNKEGHRVAASALEEFLAEAWGF